MPDSLSDARIADVLAQARTPQTRTLTVDGNQVAITKPFASPLDWRDHWIYFLMVDRFNNEAAAPTNRPFDSLFGGIQGGTLSGIRARLPYLLDLGVGAIWMTPVLQNSQFLESSYHGYAIQNFVRVDPRFGSDEDLIDLVDEAHARGMYVIFDVVINHAGNVFSYVGHGSEAPFQSFPYDSIEWRLADGTPNPSWRNAPNDLLGDPQLNAEAAVLPTELLDNDYFRRQGSKLSGTTGDFLSLKELATDHLEDFEPGVSVHGVRNRMIQIYQYVIAKYDCDGFRIDTLKHVERDFARIFGNAIREFAQSIGKRNFFTFGEVFDNEEQLARYTGRFARDRDDLVGVDAALDFPLRFTLPDVVKGFQSPANLANLYQHRKNVQRHGLGEGAVISSHGMASRFFTTFIDNHDGHGRFRFLDPTDPSRFDDQVTMAVALLFGLQGIPVIYYGTELGFSGHGDSDLAVREALWGAPNAFDQTDPFYVAIRDIAALHARQPALRYGRQYFRPISGSGNQFGISGGAPGIVAFSRILNDREVLVVANAFTNASFSGFVLVDYTLNLDGLTLDLLYSNKAAPTPPGAAVTKAEGTVTIHRLDGSVSEGPARAVPFTLQPMEVQILGRPHQ
jgi:glycosidase